MKKVEAIVPPQVLAQVQQALDDLGIEGITVMEVHGRSRGAPVTRVYRGAAYQPDLHPRLRIEVVVPEQDVDEVVNVLIAAARTGTIGDGTIFVMEVADAVRIRNQQRGVAAL